MPLSKNDKDDIISQVTNSVSDTIATTVAEQIAKALKDLKSENNDENNGQSGKTENTVNEADTLEERMFDLRLGSKKKIFRKTSLYMIAVCTQMDLRWGNYSAQTGNRICR